MAIIDKALRRRAAVYCFETAQAAREAVGYFNVPSFPINWSDPARVSAAAVLLQRSRSLSVVADEDDEDEDEDMLPGPRKTTDTSSAPISFSNPKECVSAKPARKVRIILKVNRPVSNLKDISGNSSSKTQKDPTAKCRKRPRAHGEVESEHNAPTKKCHIILKIMKK